MNIKKKITLTFSIIMTVILVLISCITYQYIAHTMKEQLSQNAVNALHASTEQLNGWLLSKAAVVHTKTTSLELLADTGEVTPAMVKGFDKADPDISDLYFGRAADGAIIDGKDWVPPADFDARTRSWYKEAAAKNGLCFGEPYLDGVTKKVALPIGMPLKSNSGALLGVISEDVLIDTVFETVAKIQPFPSSFAFLLNNSGKIMAYPDDTVKGKDIHEVAALGSLTSLIDSSANHQGMGTYDKGGEEQYLVFEPIASTGWILGISVPVSVIYAPLITLRWIFAIGTILALLIIIAASWLVARRISQPIEQLQQIASQVAAGDFTQSVEIEGTDEIAKLATGFNTMQEDLRTLIRKVQEQSSHLAAASEELTASAQQTSLAANQVADSITNVAARTDEQRTAVTHTTQVVTDMSHDLAAISATSHSVAEASADATQAALNSREDVSTMMQMMEQIETAVQSANNVIGDLGHQTDRIGRITDTIVGIAEQTNLLALNAAIEAARAGEAGKGFSVVADEVRKLAEQSQSAAQKISEEILAIQQNTGRAVQVMSEGNERVHAGVDKVNTVGGSLGQIAERIERSHSGVTEIQNSLQKLVTASQDIDAAVQRIGVASTSSADESQTVSAAAEEQIASMNEIASASESLAKLAQELQAAVETFKL